MELRFTLNDILRDRKISVYRLIAESGLPGSTVRRIARNSTPSIRLEHLQTILDTLCELTGHCYDVNDIIKVHYKGQESHASLRDEACDSVVKSAKSNSLAYIQQPDGHYKDGYHHEQ